MRLLQLLNVVAMAMPHATAMPAPALEQRGTLMSAAQFNFLPFNLTNVGMECTRPNATAEMYDCELRFDWHDPNSVKENDITSCTCINKWSWDGYTTSPGQKNTYGADFSICLRDLPTFFEMRFSGFNSTQDFDLEIAHHYTDSENFSVPWNHPTTFATPSLHLPIIKREDTILRLYEAGPIYVNITGVSD
ncbi:hypothetical protein DL546_005435 [Coniochaeta pulveracea]|uniref:Uncharacterized protein n=1 Tax=Coniochaeta pulveracea TaxID=177199 RepID=A0A420Y8U2_9PEZI|nr:hypothetical protein DL546_005435 [Coniochaeta pulveracea]